jgi:predicted nucleotidyltransferase/DNA-binding XRE family transcriptional regulator
MRTAEEVETLEAGHLVHLSPRHFGEVLEGTEIVEPTPIDEFRRKSDHVARRIAEDADDSPIYLFRYTLGMTEIGTTIRNARATAHLSQVELAALAGTSQPALARYEAGTTIPTLPTLERLLSACGRQLQIQAPPLAENARATSVRGQLGIFAEQLRHQRRAILDAARKRGIARIRVFGSVARGEAEAGSDLDLLVELKPGRTLVDLAGFRRDVSDLLDLPVDVATPDMLKARLRDEVLEEAMPL